jgi:hypothetical protein
MRIAADQTGAPTRPSSRESSFSRILPRTTNVTDQFADRCPQCAAAVRPGAQWCTLCFADLRPRDAAPAEPAPATAAAETSGASTVSGASLAFDPLTAPLALLEHGQFGGAAPESAAPESAAPESAAPGSAAPEHGLPERGGGEAGGELAPSGSVQAKLAGWPCMTCGEVVAIDLSVCPACGAGFMAPGPGLGATEGLGKLGALGDKKAQLRIMIGGAGLLCLVILLVLFIVGAFF